MINKTRSLNLLVVEDNPGDYILLEEYLYQSQLPINKIFHAENMAAVPALIKDNSFDIALLDLTLPDSTGIDSVIVLDSLLPKTPIVVFSGLSAIEIAMESISVGAQDFLVKSEFDEKLLAKCIQYSIERKKTHEKLKESNERYELVNKATLDTVWEWNFSTNSGLWGDGIIKTFGYSEKDLIYNEDWGTKYIHPEDRDRVISKINYHLDNNLENCTDEYRFRDANGMYRFVLCRTYILYNSEEKPYRMIGALGDITERKRLERELSTQQVRQQKLITEVTIQAQEKERDELGKELHDNINQILATIKMYLGLIKSNQTLHQNLLERSYEFVNEAIEEIRKLSKTLITPSLGDSGLHQALQILTNDVNVTNGLQVHLLYEIEEDQVIGDKEELMLYRIVQEQINNIRKHANAQTATITLKTDSGNIILTIADDGIGFNHSKKAEGIGLKNINSRVEFYSGKMDIISAPGQGCKLEIIIPY